MALFIGLRPWSTRGPQIEFDTDAGIIDLHNDARIVRLTIAPESSTLTLAFVYYGDWEEPDVDERVVELEFGGIKNLKLELPADYEPRAATTLEGILYQNISGQSFFDVDMGDIQCSLIAETLTLRDV
ncbi:hypothetical protein [Nonomuraea sp. NPDC005650]|uniref:hypothetical protein n=1 Tax=Nonomuraea sp. NPDC005650 TaxID=3157045 RepID=UPI0033BC959A